LKRKIEEEAAYETLGHMQETGGAATFREAAILLSKRSYQVPIWPKAFWFNLLISLLNKKCCLKYVSDN